MKLLDAVGDMYNILTRNEAVYLFYLVPIIYFTSIIARLVFYKVKYRQPLRLSDIMAMGTMLLIGLDYINYLYLYISKKGMVLPFAAFVIKYTFGFLLWAWMFWYAYQVHLKRSLTKETLKKGRIFLVCGGSMFLILLLIIFVVAK